MRQRGSRRRPEGFTLVELLMAIVVVGVMTGIAASRIDVTRMHMNTTVQVLSTTMVATQREAITKQHDLILTFDAAKRTLTIIWDANNNGAVEANERQRVIELDSRAVFGRGTATARSFGTDPINFNRTINGLPALIFHRNGSASGIGGFYISSARAAGDARWAEDTRAVEIVRATGRTEWFRYTGSSWTRGF